MKNTEFSAGILPYIPFLYVIWSDDLLSASEIDIVSNAINNDNTLSPKEVQLLKSWLDKKLPPKDTTLKAWQRYITKSQQQLVESSSYPLHDFAIKIAQNYGSTLEKNEALQHIELHLGIQPNHYNHLFLVAVDMHNSQATANPKALNSALYQDALTVLQELKEDLKDPLFTWEHLSNKDEHRKRVLEQTQYLAAKGWGAYAYPEAYGGKNDLKTYAEIFEHLMYVDGSLAVKFGVQFGLFGGSIHNLGSSYHHDLYLKATGETKLLGCFAMTETGHGSNVRGIKTTATYVHESKSLIIDTPGRNDNKEYIGNALHSKMATVFAQLIVNGKNEGVHAILVPLRDAEHNTLAGITIEDNGQKMGLNGVDNGKIWFSNVSVPVENLLSRYGGINDKGIYESSIKNPNKRFFTMLGTLVGGRICVAKGALAGAKMALTIAVKHSLKRRQFNEPGKIQEDLLLDYPTHQLRLIPKVASAYVYHFVLQKAMLNYHATSDDKREIETQVAGLKAIITWFSTVAIQEAREACGGKGYLTENRIDGLKGDSDIFTTFEGDNTVLLQLAAKGVLSDFKSDFNEGGFRSVLRLLGSQLSDKIATINPAYTNKVDSAHLYNPKFHLHALDFRLRRLTYTAAMRIRGYVKKGVPSYQAYLKTQTHLLEVGKAYSNVLAIKWYYDTIASFPKNEQQSLFYKLGALHSLSVIRANASWYLEQGYINGDKSKAIRQRVERLSTELRPEILALVDGFGIPEHLMTAPIAT